MSSLKEEAVMDTLRYQLAEECARQQLEGKAPSAATLRLLRRVANSELCCRQRLFFFTDLSRALPSISRALEESLLRRPGWLTLESAPGSAPVGLGPYPAAALLFNGIWFFLQAHSPSLKLSLFPWADGFFLRMSGAGALSPVTISPGSDAALTLGTLTHLTALAGGRFFTAAGSQSLSLAFFLPACSGKDPGFYLPTQLVADRFGPLHLFLAGYTVPPDWEEK